MRGQVPGTTCSGARTTSATNNYQVSGYVRAEREWRAGISSGTPEWNTRVPEWNPRVAEEPPLAVVLDQVRRHWLASQYVCMYCTVPLIQYCSPQVNPQVVPTRGYSLRLLRLILYNIL